VDPLDSPANSFTKREVGRGYMVDLAYVLPWNSSSSLLLFHSTNYTGN